MNYKLHLILPCRKKLINRPYKIKSQFKRFACPFVAAQLKKLRLPDKYCNNTYHNLTLNIYLKLLECILKMIEIFSRAPFIFNAFTTVVKSAPISVMRHSQLQH